MNIFASYGRDLTMASGLNTSWTSQYSALADALLQFKDDRAPLVEIVKAAYIKAGLQRPKLDDYEFTDIDPC